MITDVWDGAREIIQFAGKTMGKSCIGSMRLSFGNMYQSLQLIAQFSHSLFNKLVTVFLCADSYTKIWPSFCCDIHFGSTKSRCSRLKVLWFCDQPGFRGICVVAIVRARGHKGLPPYPQVFQLASC